MRKPQPAPDHERLARALVLYPDLEAHQRIAAARAAIGGAVAKLAEAHALACVALGHVRRSRSASCEEFTPGDYLDAEFSIETSLEADLAGSLSFIVAAHLNGDKGDITDVIARLGGLLTRTGEEVEADVAAELAKADPDTLRALRERVAAAHA